MAIKRSLSSLRFGARTAPPVEGAMVLSSRAKAVDSDFGPEYPDKDVDAAASSRGPQGADDVVQALRRRIQRQDLAPGEWLREARLCCEFGVGRSIVRRALRALADDGLVELEANRGARVSATTVEEVFDLYEVRAALYGLAARFACRRASDSAIRAMLVKIDQMLDVAARRVPAEEIIALSEAIFSDMAALASPDAQHMIEAIRRKTRFHYSCAALTVFADGHGPYEHWRRVRTALQIRDADAASQAARDILYFMQGEVARIMLTHGIRGPEGLILQHPSATRAPSGGTKWPEPV